MPVNPSTLSLQNVVDVVVEVTPQAAPRATFNQALIIGSSMRLTAAQRIIQVDQNFSAEMLAAPYGFQVTDPEYIAAELYFGQSPAPASGFIGMQDMTAIKAVAIDSDNEGTGFALGDTISVNGVTGSVLTVSSISGGGSAGPITGLTITNYGTGAAIGDEQTCSIIKSVAGAGPVKVHITAVGETALQAIQACRAANFEWYVGVCLQARWKGVNVVGAITGGAAYTAALNLPTTGGTGTGCTVDITVTGGAIATVSIHDPGDEYTAADELTVVQGVNTSGSFAVSSVESDHSEIALWTESAQPSTVYAFRTAGSYVLNGTAGNVCLILQGDSYRRTLSQYSTTQGGNNENAAYAMCAILGYAMGQNTGLSNSAYTLKFKGEVGILTEPLTLTEIANIEGANCNLYLSYGNFYNWFEQGKMANGMFFDQIVNRDMLVNDIQLNIADLLNSVPKIPQTDPGETTLIHAVNAAAQKGVDRGYLAPGTFNPVNGLPLLTLQPGAALPKGFQALAAPYSTQAAADRSARKAMPIYLVVQEAGAVHFVTIEVLVQV